MFVSSRLRCCNRVICYYRVSAHEYTDMFHVKQYPRVLMYGWNLKNMQSIALPQVVSRETFAEILTLVTI